MVKTLLVNAAERVAPRLVWHLRINAWKIDTEEAEDRILPWVCDRQKISVDVGGAVGAYSMRLLLYSSRVVVFEPNPQAAKNLRKLFLRTRILTLEEVALSDDSGVITLRIPADRPMRSTIEQTNNLQESSVVEHLVKRKRLDDYHLGPVGFIKIDVEGHECAVLEGAKCTIERERPNLLIEIEDRHNPGSFKRTTAFLDAAEYAGYFLLGEELTNIQSFDPEKHQDSRNLVDGHRRGTYINNFLFVPKERVKDIRGSTKRSFLDSITPH